MATAKITDAIAHMHRGIDSPIWPDVDEQTPALDVSVRGLASHRDAKEIEADLSARTYRGCGHPSRDTSGHGTSACVHWVRRHYSTTVSTPRGSAGATEAPSRLQPCGLVVGGGPGMR